jgi:hypothetical protein
MLSNLDPWDQAFVLNTELPATNQPITREQAQRLQMREMQIVELRQTLNNINLREFLASAEESRSFGEVTKNPGVAAENQLENYIKEEKFTTEKRDPETHKIIYKPEERNPETNQVTREANTIPVRVKNEARIKHIREQIELRAKRHVEAFSAGPQPPISKEAQEARGELLLDAMELINQQITSRCSEMNLVAVLINEVDRDFPPPEGHPKSGEITPLDAANFANEMLAFAGFYERVKPEEPEPDAAAAKP